MKKSSNLNTSCKVVFYLNKWNKKVGSPSSFGRKRPFMSLNRCTFIENLSSSERARARARANPAKNDAQKGCAMQLNGITLIIIIIIIIIMIIIIIILIIIIMICSRSSPCDHSSNRPTRVKTRPKLFKSWIALSTGRISIHWIDAIGFLTLIH